MKYLITFALAMAMATGLMAQESDLQAKYDKKMEKAFASHVKWVLSFQEAKKLAVKEKKLIVGYFTRSYAP